MRQVQDQVWYRIIKKAQQASHQVRWPICEQVHVQVEDEVHVQVLARAHIFVYNTVYERELGTI